MYLSKVKQRIILNCVQLDWKQKDSIQLQNDFELFAKIDFKTFYQKSLHILPARFDFQIHVASPLPVDNFRRQDLF